MPPGDRLCLASQWQGVLACFPLSAHCDTYRSVRLLVEWAANGFRATIQDMGIDHGGLHVLMPEQFLHGPNIVSGFQQMRRKRVAEGMTGDVFVDSGQACGGAHGFLQTTFIQVMATLGTRAGVHRTALSWKHVLPAPLTVGVGIFALQGIREI